MTGIAGLPPAKRAAHEAAVTRLRDAYAAVPPGVPVRLAKPTSNLFRFREAGKDAGGVVQQGAGGVVQQGAGEQRRELDVSAFSRVLHVDPQARTAVVGGMTTYEDLVDATLPHGLMPLVVPQLKTITLGGAVSGLGIESTSLRSGMPHESVLEMQILTGDGRVVIATADNEHSDLFFGFPNSYGTLGYSLALTIELEPVKPYVHLRHFRFTDPKSCMDAIAEVAVTGEHAGHRADFIDGTAFSPGELYLTVGAFSDKAPWRSDYTRQKVFYQSQRTSREDFLAIRDYLWRWDTDWFWCSRPFGVQNRYLRPLWPRRYRRSDVYRKLVAFDRKYGLTATMDEHAGRMPKESVIQDVEIPVASGAGFLEFFAREVKMSPVWMCPLRLRGQRTWPLYPMKPGEVYVNFGFWGMARLPAGQDDGYYNRLIEDEVSALGGHKSLYSTSFYSADEFRRRYNGAAYDKLKSQYDEGGRLLGLYDKCVRGR